MKAEACPSGPQNCDPRGRSLAGPPSTPGVRVATPGRGGWLGEAMSAARPGEGTRGGEIGVSPPELGSEDGALPIACRVPAPRDPFQALKLPSALIVRTQGDKRCGHPAAQMGEPRHRRGVWPRCGWGLKLVAGGAGGWRTPGSRCGGSIRGLASCPLGDPRGLRCRPRAAGPV